MNEILKAIAADTNVSDEFRAALPVGHTPGPWGYHGNLLVQIRPDGSIPINSRIVGEFIGKVSDADCALIAAAPELLEALRRCMGSLRAVSPGGDGDPDVEFARATIAKATT